MKKSVLVAALIGISLLSASCSISSNKTDYAVSGINAEATESAEVTATGGMAGTAETAGITGAEGQERAAEPARPIDTGLTLEGIKKAAQAAGCKVEDMQDNRVNGGSQPVNGFSVIYKEENNETYIPVYEFKNADEALTFAKEVNEAGYNLCIVNGKFLTITGAKYGIPVNDKETAVLESLLQSKVMEYTQAPLAPIEPAKDFAGAYLQIDTIQKALDKLVNKSVMLHDKTAQENENIENAFITFNMTSSADLSFVATLSEDQAKLDAITQIWEMFGVADFKLKHDGANDYVLSGQRAGVDTKFEMHCIFDPTTGSLSLKDTDGGNVVDWYEFVPLGGDRYAFQTLYERAIVEYKDGKIRYFIYSVNPRSKEFAYSPDSDSIYGKTSGIDEVWVSKAGEDSYDQFLSYDGAKIKIAANKFAGGRLKTEIAAQQ